MKALFVPRIFVDGKEYTMVEGKLVPRIHGASNINGPIPDEWRPYVTQSNVGLEVVPHILYDTQTFTSASTVSLDFFSAVPANIQASNVNPPRVLANPSSFLIQNISLWFDSQLQTVAQGATLSVPANKFSDMEALCRTGILTLTIGQKPYGPWPIFRLPVSTFPKGGLAVAGATATNFVNTTGNSDGPLYSLVPNLLIAPLQQFSATISWPAAVTLSGNMILKVLLDGQLSRAIQ